jgi:hypothetical protein
MSHAASALCCAAFVAPGCDGANASRRPWLWLGLLGALMTLVRIQTSC